MTVTGVEWCDFFIWLDDEVHQETIEFDWFCNMIKDKLDMFYLNNFLWSFTCNNNMEKKESDQVFLFINGPVNKVKMLAIVHSWSIDPEIDNDTTDSKACTLAHA